MASSGRGRIHACVLLAVWLVLSSLACAIGAKPTAEPPTATPSPLPTDAPTATPLPAATIPPSPTAIPTPKLTPTRRSAAASYTPTPEATPTSETPAATAGPSVATGVNLLKNPGFEGQYSPYGGKVEWNVPDGWIPWFFALSDQDLAPEFKPAEPPYYDRIHSGERAQQYFKTFGTYTAGVFQRVKVAPGVNLRFSIYGQGWSHDGSNDCPIEQSCHPADMGMRVGIDPLGGSNPRADSVVWSGRQSPTDGWAFFTVEATAESEYVSVFAWASPNEPRKNQDTYWDDAVLEALP